MNENLLWIIVAFVAYMLMMIIIGACYMKKRVTVRIIFKPGSYYHCKSLHKGTGRRNSSGICRCCR